MKVVFLLILFIKTEKTTCKVFRDLLRCEDFSIIIIIILVLSVHHTILKTNLGKVLSSVFGPVLMIATYLN